VRLWGLQEFFEKNWGKCIIVGNSPILLKGDIAMNKPLTPQEEKVFKWCAEQDPTEEIYFARAMEALGIDNAYTLYFILEGFINNKWTSGTIQNIFYGGVYSLKQSYFMVSINAHHLWKKYAETEPKCSVCEEPIVNKTFNYCPYCGNKLDKN